MRIGKQGTLEIKHWGGLRKGAGRNPGGSHSRVAHSERAPLWARHPAHITLRIASRLKNRRHKGEFAVVSTALAAGADRLDTRIVEYAVVSNHVQLICESGDERALARAMRGACVRVARRLDRT